MPRPEYILYKTFLPDETEMVCQVYGTDGARYLFTPVGGKNPSAIKLDPSCMPSPRKAKPADVFGYVTAGVKAYYGSHYTLQSTPKCWTLIEGEWVETA